jgi:hypothetical protein|tara:strand:+ start:304 stop:738 length:435 start_codon:yes stop_codon:yes gene_type:complete
MDGTEESNRDKNKEQNELSVGDRTAHGTKYPFLQEFSELIHSLSIAEIEPLLTQAQKRMATHLWEAENYGGSIDKAKKRLEDLYGTQWFKVTSFKEHFTPLKDYYISILIAEHKRQWSEKYLSEKPKKTATKEIAKINQENKSL